MNKIRKGFTLIEVAIFLAITGLLFIGVTLGVQNSLNQQRENDSVQSFMEFLRGVYSQVNNVQNVGNGQSEKAVYGKLVTFGEELNLQKEANENSVFVYTIIGSIMESGTGQDTLSALASLGVNVLQPGEEGGLDYLGMVENYTPKWGAEVQPGCFDKESCFENLKGSLLIVRHPMSGNTYTYYRPETIQVNKAMADGHANPFKYDLSSKNYLTDGGFKRDAVDFCLNVSNGNGKGSRRFDVRIVAGAHNASGVELVPDNNIEGINAITQKDRNKCNE